MRRVHRESDNMCQRCGCIRTWTGDLDGVEWSVALCSVV